MQPASQKAPLVVLWRILGNDVVPRHVAGQTLRNLEFILEHEPDFPGCRKMFLLNRIMDEEAFDRIQTLLQQTGAGYEVIPFMRDAYLAQQQAQDKLRYITNVNAARNHCIKHGLTTASVVLPFDGNCFFNRAGWQSFFEVAHQNRDAVAFVVAMWRLRKNEHALQKGRKPQLQETVRRRLWGTWPVRAPVEPQIGFTRAGDVLFDEDLVYAKCDKAELLWRLGVPGPWDEWDAELRKRTTERNGVSRHFGDRRLIVDAGFVCRLASGNEQADASIAYRGVSRKTGIADLQKRADHIYGRGK